MMLFRRDSCTPSLLKKGVLLGVNKSDNTLFFRLVLLMLFKEASA